MEHGDVRKLKKEKEPDLQNLEKEPFRQRKEPVYSPAGGPLKVSSGCSIQRVKCQAFQTVSYSFPRWLVSSLPCYRFGLDFCVLMEHLSSPPSCSSCVKPPSSLGPLLHRLCPHQVKFSLGIALYYPCWFQALTGQLIGRELRNEKILLQKHLVESHVSLLSR